MPRIPNIAYENDSGSLVLLSRVANHFCEYAGIFREVFYYEYVWVAFIEDVMVEHLSQEPYFSVDELETEADIDPYFMPISASEWIKAILEVAMMPSSQGVIFCQGLDEVSVVMQKTTDCVATQFIMAVSPGRSSPTRVTYRAGDLGLDESLDPLGYVYQVVSEYVTPIDAWENMIRGTLEDFITLIAAFRKHIYSDESIALTVDEESKLNDIQNKIEAIYKQVDINGT
ncbi:hypothetical protein Pla110_06580 [Polystyrenella longa]|uniref:Uncharacterized protein n=1 Tax=Polystyrenella longa TaxID=2528007 RepID=A0A518CIF2_9PLAN|nr:hypothetical protein [Polystyrenella longa]QDU78954.1 hypothetical protein Pla110_06580 [Polystyrenella longa]